MGLRSLWYISFMALTVTTAAHADTYVVAPDGSGDYPTIQAAIDAATDGDVIELLDGVFTGDGNRDIDPIGKAVTIRSQSGVASACVIDCEGSESDPYRGFIVSSGEGRDTVIEGITVANGWRPNVLQIGGGGGIRCYNSSPTIRNCIFDGNHARGGGGIIVRESGASPLIEECLFVNNTAIYGGGGLSSHWSSSAEIHNCRFEGNYSELLGGGLYVSDYSVPVIDGCTFIGNHADDSGGGFYDRSPPGLLITNCEFNGNTAGGGGGVYLYITGSPAILRNCTFYANTASIARDPEGRGAAVRCYDTSAVVENCIITDSLDGEAVYGSVTMVCSDVYNNVDGPGSVGDQIGVNGNFAADPQYCNPENGDLSIFSTSPCATSYNPTCGLIGAYPIGCGVDLPYFEDFDDSEAFGFQEIAGDWEIVNGAYRCLNESAGTKHYSVVGSADWADYRFEVDIATYGSGLQEVMVRYQPQGSWYLVTFSSEPDNGIFLHKQVGDEQTLLLHIDDFPNENEVWHNLAVRVIQNRIIGYFDGAFVFTYTDENEPLLDGGIGLVSTAGYDVGWQYAHFDNVSVEEIDPTAIDGELAPPHTSWLEQNIPNPFNPQTTIRYDLPHDAAVTLSVFDVAGREIRRLVGGAVQSRGRHETMWNGTDATGRAVAAGVYFYRLEAGGYAETRRMSLIR